MQETPIKKELKENSHEPTMVINNVPALAKIAKAYGVPTILTKVYPNEQFVR